MSATRWATLYTRFARRPSKSHKHALNWLNDATIAALFPHLCSLFEMVVKYFDAFLTQVPLSFVLGFYVSYVANRWWQQFLAIPWPDK